MTFCTDMPSQKAPPLRGAGLVQVRERFCQPRPQRVLQLDHSVHEDQPPFTAKHQNVGSGGAVPEPPSTKPRPKAVSAGRAWLGDPVGAGFESAQQEQHRLKHGSKAGTATSVPSHSHWPQTTTVANRLLLLAPRSSLATAHQVANSLLLLAPNSSH